MIAWLCALGAFAQDVPPALTIEQALAQSLGVSEEVAIAAAGLERADLDRWRVRSGALPQLALSATYTRTVKTEFDRFFSAPTDGAATGTTGTGTGTTTGTGTGTTGTGTGTTTGTGTGTTGTGAPSAAGGGASGGIQLPFGQDNSYRVTVSLTQPLFSGGRLGAGMKIAAAGLDNAGLQLDATRARAALDVARAYFDAALADRLLGIAQETAQQADATLAQTRAAHEVGRKPDFELLRAEVQSQNQAVAVVRAARGRDAAFLRLQQLLELPSGGLSLTTPLGDAPSPTVADAAVQVTGASTDRPERLALTQAERAVAIQEQVVVLTRAQRLPTLALTGAAGWTSYPEPLISFDPDAWYPNVSAGLALSVPLFGGGRVLAETAQAKADLTAARARAEQAAELSALEQSDAQRLLLLRSKKPWENVTEFRQAAQLPTATPEAVNC
jgi:outer membrane protein TolC